MWLLNQTSSAARTALVYITVGALMVIWTGVWFLYLRNNPPNSSGLYYLCGGLLMTGLTLIGIGLGVGQIGRSARHADLPAQEVVPAVTETQPAAPTVDLVTPPNAPAAVVVPAGQVKEPTTVVSQPGRARMAS
ncbi:MAG TPA: hypothetical protein VE988_04555 [Gemmataceae bacterium]|nr:hypothetical protein [Gemmataceae bacterium]